MSFPTPYYVLAFVSAGLTSFLTLPLWRRWCRRAGLVDDPGHRKIHAAPMPLAGGFAVGSGLLLPLAGAALLLRAGVVHAPASAALTYGLHRRGGQLAAIAGGALGMLLLGSLDDKHELRAGPKFLGQLFIALLVAAAGVRITLFVPSLVFSYFITLAWILTVATALNIIDNMNGLCGGLGAIGAWFFAAHAAAQGQYLVALIAFLACGALAGFLPYNYPRATAFLGDSGSHLVGFLLAVLAILPHFYSKQNPRVLSVLSPLLILAVPFLDLLTVVVIRLRSHKPIYVGDTNHLSHHLARRGLPPPVAVLCLWAAASVCGALSLWL